MAQFVVKLVDSTDLGSIPVNVSVFYHDVNIWSVIIMHYILDIGY